MPNEFPIDGIVYVLRSDLHPALSKIGYSRHSGGALGRLNDYSEDHGFKDWVVHSELVCVTPALVERRVHDKLREGGLERKTATGSRELFYIAADKATKLIEQEAMAQCVLLEAAIVSFREAEKVRRHTMPASPDELVEERAALRRVSLYEDWKRTGKW